MNSEKDIINNLRIAEYYLTEHLQQYSSKSKVDYMDAYHANVLFYPHSRRYCCVLQTFAIRNAVKIKLDFEVCINYLSKEVL